MPWKRESRKTTNHLRRLRKMGDPNSARCGTEWMYDVSIEDDEGAIVIEYKYFGECPIEASVSFGDPEEVRFVIEALEELLPYLESSGEE